MGRRKIRIEPVRDDKLRQATFTKRKNGILKKCYELSVLCDCDLAMLIFSQQGKLIQYASNNVEQVLMRYTEYGDPNESRTNDDVCAASSIQ
jgi:hypothetical protein